MIKMCLTIIIFELELKKMDRKIEKLITICIQILGSKKELAEYVRSTERTIFRWLSGESKPNASSIVKMYDLAIKKSHTI
jgi:hypothetical protein